MGCFLGAHRHNPEVGIKAVIGAETVDAYWGSSSPVVSASGSGAANLR